MKQTLILSVVLILLAGGSYWYQNQQLAAIQEDEPEVTFDRVVLLPAGEQIEASLFESDELAAVRAAQEVRGGDQVAVGATSSAKLLVDFDNYIALAADTAGEVVIAGLPTPLLGLRLATGTAWGVTENQTVVIYDTDTEWSAKADSGSFMMNDHVVYAIHGGVVVEGGGELVLLPPRTVYDRDTKVTRPATESDQQRWQLPN